MKACLKKNHRDSLINQYGDRCIILRPDDKTKTMTIYAVIDSDDRFLSFMDYITTSTTIAGDLIAYQATTKKAVRAVEAAAALRSRRARTA